MIYKRSKKKLANISTRNRSLAQNNKKLLTGALALLILVGIFMTIIILKDKSISIFGHQIGTSGNSSRRSNRSGTIELPSSDMLQNTKACGLVASEAISTIAKEHVSKLGSVTPDVNEPYLTSTCIFVSSSKDLVISVLYREMKNEAQATKTLDVLSGNKEVEKISGIGNRAIFNSGSNQLTVQQGLRITTLTVSKNTGDNFNNKEVAVSIAKKLSLQ